MVAAGNDCGGDGGHQPRPGPVTDPQRAASTSASLTNLTSEHLEFHGSLETYRAAKAMLFQQAPIAILNADDPSFAFFRDRAARTGS